MWGSGAESEDGAATVLLAVENEDAVLADSTPQ